MRGARQEGTGRVKSLDTQRLGISFVGGCGGYLVVSSPRDKRPPNGLPLER